jgi:hypothetical protein
MVSAQDQGPSDMNSLPWGSISVAYMLGLFVTFLQAAPEAFDRCYQFSYCTSLVMENVAWSLVWPAYWLMS